MKSFVKAILCSSIVILSTSLEARAQEIRTVEPVSMFKSVDNDNPLRYYHASDPGIPAGDINGDGIQEYIVHNPYYPDKSTPESGDYTNNTLIYNVDENAAIAEYSIRSGVLLQPAGDLNGDGRDELAAVIDSILYIYTFPAGDLDISGNLELIFEEDVSLDMNQFVTGFDFDKDEKEDLLLGTYDYLSGSSLHVLFGGDTGGDFELKEVDLEKDIPGLEIQTNAGDIVGDEGAEIVLLTTTAWPYQVGTAVFSINESREITFSGSDEFGTITSGANSLRFFVANIDGEGKDDLMYSLDRYSRGGGLTQVHFNAPVPYFQLSVTDTTTAEKSTSQSSGEMPNWVEKTGKIGLGFDHVEAGDGSIRLGFSGNGGLHVVFGFQISVDEDIPEPAEVETGNSDDYVFQTKFSPQIRSNGVLVGVGNPSLWTGGRVHLEAVLGPSLTVVRDDVSFSDFYSETREVGVIEPDGSDILIGLGVMGEWFPTQYLSLFAHAGLRLDFIGEDEVSSPTGSEPTGSTTINGDQVVDLIGGTNLYGADGFVVWFRKAINPVVADTASLVHSIRVSDFQELGEDDEPFIRSANIGDINNDGFDDLLMSSGSSYANGSPINKAWLFYGGETYNTMPDYTFDFSQDSASANTFGTYITLKMMALGDVNGDGIDDFAITSGGYGSAGGVYVYFGDDEFFSTSATQTTFKYPDLILTPEIQADQLIYGFGQDISAGDFNGDGAVDIAVSIQTGYGTPAPPTIYLYEGGEQMDGSADLHLTATRSSLGDTREDAVVSGTNGNTIVFLPSENEDTHQDLLFTPGGFSGYLNAVIFEGGAEADSLPDISLKNPNIASGFGAFGGSKPGVGDLNDDGFYDILMLIQADYEDAFVSSRAYFFSPNANIIIDSNEEQENPFGYRLSQNYPNPFNPTTKIEFRLANTSNVTLKVFDVLGREVATILDDVKYQGGSQTVEFDASRLASGVYLYQLKTNSFTQTRKMTLIK